MFKKEHTSINQFVVFKSKFYNNKMLIQFISQLILQHLQPLEQNNITFNGIKQRHNRNKQKLVF